MVNAKRIFFIIVRKGLRGVRLCCPEIYSTCDSKTASASRALDYRKARQSGRALMPRPSRVGCASDISTLIFHQEAMARDLLSIFSLPRCLHPIAQARQRVL